MNRNEINDIVKQAVRKYRTSDPFMLAAAMDIDVDCADLGGLKGFYIVYNGDRYIVVNKYLEEHMARLVVAHEIGHDCLHRDMAERGGLRESGFFDMASKPEKEANIFAANLLISDSDMLELGEEGYTIEEIAKKLEVHYQVALIKAADMNSRGYNANVPFVPDSGFLGTNF